MHSRLVNRFFVDDFFAFFFSFSFLFIFNQLVTTIVIDVVKTFRQGGDDWVRTIRADDSKNRMFLGREHTVAILLENYRFVVTAKESRICKLSSIG